MAGATFVVLLVGAAIRATPDVLMLPLEHGLGASRATIEVTCVLGGLHVDYRRGSVTRGDPAGRHR